MPNEININSSKQKYIVCFILAAVTLIVYWQVNGFEFINFDDPIYVVENGHVKSGITLDGIRWAFSTNHFPIWIPMIWLSMMLDYQIFGMNAGGYHVTNLILHILSSLILFWLFCRMTKEIWKSAFIAALFALHPLHVESVAWVTERKDVLSVFFWMLTLCLYVYYTEKPVLRRYLLVVFCFVLDMMSKPMVITLPVIMILLDYWPLKRFELKKDNPFLWQLKEKAPFFILSLAFAAFTLYNTDKTDKFNTYLQVIPLGSRLANAFVSFFIYLEKTFWPYNMACFYPFPSHLPFWQVLGTALVIIVITAFVFAKVKRMPFLFVGWMWCAIIIFPVIGIIQISLEAPYAMADRYHYLPFIGISVMMAWGIPLLFTKEETRRKILFPAGIVFIAILSLLTWKQCSYWQHSSKLWNHALQVTKNNYMAYGNIGVTLSEKGKHKEALDYFNKAISIKPDHILLYLNRGGVYTELGQYQNAFDDFNKAILLKKYNANSYKARGFVYYRIGQYENAIKDFTKAIFIEPDRFDLYYLRGNTYFDISQYQKAFEDFDRAIGINPQSTDALSKRGTIYLKYGRYQQALHDFNKVIALNPDYSRAYNNRANIYAQAGQYKLALEDLDNAIRLDPNYISAYFNRGFLLAKVGQNQRAVEDFSIVITNRPDDTKSINNRALGYIQLGQYESGCKDAKKACSLGDCKLFELAKGKRICR